MIATIFFDIGGVLLNIHPERTLSLLSDSTGFPANLLERVLAGDIHDRYERGEITDDEFFTQFRDSLPKPNGVPKDDFFRAWLALLGEPTETMSLALELKETYPVWLVSNTNRYHIEHGPTLEHFARFTGCIYSFEIGARKPERAFFRAALQRAGAEANSTLFIDDKRGNVEVARGLGFHAIQYQSTPQLETQLNAILKRTLRWL